MSQSDEDEERESVMKRERRQEDITMRGNFHLQQANKVALKTSATVKTKGEFHVF